LEYAQIGYKHPVIGSARPLEVEIEGIGILHQELATAHDAEARANFVAELPLYVIEHPRQLTITLHSIAKDICDELLIRRTVDHLALVAIDDAQHFLAINIVAARLLPEFCGLDRGHKYFLTSRAILLLANDVLDALQHTQAQRQPRIYAGACLADHAGPQHQTVRDNLSLGLILLHRGQEIGR